MVPMGVAAVWGLARTSEWWQSQLHSQATPICPYSDRHAAALKRRQ